MNKRQVKVGMVLKLKYWYKEILFLVIKNDKEKDYVEAFDQEFNTVKITRNDLKNYKIAGQYHKDEWNNMFSPITTKKKTLEWIPLKWEDDSKMVCDFPYELDGSWVIVTTGKLISIERIKKDAYDHFFPNGRWFELPDVIGWMPLSELYIKNNISK